MLHIRTDLPDLMRGSKDNDSGENGDAGDNEERGEDMDLELHSRTWVRDTSKVILLTAKANISVSLLAYQTVVRAK